MHTDDAPRRYLPRCPPAGADACRNDACRYALPGEARCALLVVETHGAMTLQEVGDALGCTREYVRQVEARALDRLVRGLRIIGADVSPQWKALLRDIDLEDDGAKLREVADEEGVATIDDVLRSPRLARLAVLRAQRPQNIA